MVLLDLRLTTDQLINRFKEMDYVPNYLNNLWARVFGVFHLSSVPDSVRLL